MKILYVSDVVVNTGYGIVSRELIKGMLMAGHEVEAISWGGYDPNRDRFDLPVKVYSPGQNDYWGRELITPLVSLAEPSFDAIWFTGDPWMFEPFENLPVLNDLYTIVYFPIDGLPIPPKWIPMLNKFDKLITISKFAQEAVKRVLPHREILQLYHGVDLNIFKQLSQEQRNNLRINNNLNEKFVVLTVCRNQPRKNIPVLIKAFSKFAKNKNDVVLLLRTANEDMGWNISELIDRFNINGKAFIIDANVRHGVPLEHLVAIYNMADLFILPTMGEGFGIPLLEAQACGVPILATDCSCIPELIHHPKQKIKVLEQIISNRNIEQAYADPKDLEQKLEYFYKNRWHLEKLSKKGLELAKTMTWDIIRAQLIEILDSCSTEMKYKNKFTYHIV